MKTLLISPVEKAFRSQVRIPGSKSITNRALPLAAMADGCSRLSGVLWADDTLQMLGALEALGYSLKRDQKACEVELTGGPIPRSQASLHCGNSGTTIRFLAALCATGQGDFDLDGIARMRQRPIGQLVEQLRALGVRVDYLMGEGFPPIRIHASRESWGGGTCRFSDAKSSQYISAILMAAPLARHDLIVELSGPITSEPYVLMTLRMMESFGVRAEISQPAADLRRIRIPAGQHYKARDYAIEPDASNASYFLAAAAICPGSSITLEGLGKGSLQGDVALADLLCQMGAGLSFGSDFICVTHGGELQGLEVDMNHIPDMVQTLAVVALFARGATKIHNVENLRYKETDRLAALERELTKLGARVETTLSSLVIHPPEKLVPASIATYDDHRMAMAFGVAGLRIPGLEIQEPECTAKTYPDFFADLARATQTPR